MSVDINLDRVDRIYRPSDKVKGTLVIKTDGGFSHSGISLHMTGVVDLQLSAKSVGLFDAFYNSLKPINICDVKLTIEKTGNLVNGVNEFPFEVDLKPLEGQELFETYHGVYVNITYSLKVDVVRKFFGKNLQKTLEFIVENAPSLGKREPKPETFILNTDSIETSSSKLKNVPDFAIRGLVDSTAVSIDDPLWGHFILEKCEEPIKGVEIQLVRVETVGSTEGFAKEATEIQNIQIADGDVPRGIEIPIHMIFPRLFTCPTVGSRTFKIEFEFNFVLMFPDGRLISKKLPLTLLR